MESAVEAIALVVFGGFALIVVSGAVWVAVHVYRDISRRY